MQTWVKTFYKYTFWLSLAGVVAFFIDFGFDSTDSFQFVLNYFYFVVLAGGILSTIIRYVKETERFRRKSSLFDLVTILFTLFLIVVHLTHYFDNQVPPFLTNIILVKLAVLLTFIREVSERKFDFGKTLLNPGQLFIVSFLFIIFIGTILLMLPNATHEGIAFTDALFTSTSAVCVTGLIVVDTGSYFTEFGQTIIMILIQTGGLGILTFASYFSYFFKGGSTYNNHLMLSKYTNYEKLGQVFSTLKHILIITFSIEIITALVIYSSLTMDQFSSEGEAIFFSIFHAISAFCNAGFTTITDGLNNEAFKFNYFLHIIVLIAFLLGGLGFPIVVNIVRYIKYKLKALFTFSKSEILYKPWVLNLNSRINLFTTSFLFLIGAIVYFILEYNNTLASHEGVFGKVISTFFNSATPRSSGFNTVDTSALSFPALMMIILYMWIGASPSSMGGGIKTSTFAIATLNFLSLAKGKTRIEVFRREISDISVRRSFAIISLSLLGIGSGIIMLSIFEPDLDLKDITFECFSAYSICGLSLGVTNELSNGSKLVLTVLMFIGRVNMLTILIAFFKKVNYKNYSYPTEEILIN